LANQKGGVGKTTSAINLGAYLTLWGKRVLLVDMDPQANATSSLGLDKHRTPSVYEVLMGLADLSEIVTLSARPNLDLAPSSPELAGAEVEMVPVKARESRLQRVLSRVDAEYDLILIDTPPSLGLLTVNSLVAAEAVIIPVQCEYLALEGLTRLLRTIEAICQGANPHLDILGILMTMYDGRTNLSRDVVEETRRHFRPDVFRTVIPRNIRLSEAPSFGEDILSYSPYCRGALAYQALAEEVLDRVAQRWPA